LKIRIKANSKIGHHETVNEDLGIRVETKKNLLK